MEKINVIEADNKNKIYKTNREEEFYIVRQSKYERGFYWYTIKFIKSANELEIRKDILESGLFVDRISLQTNYLNQPPIDPGKICYNKNDEMFIIGERVYKENNKKKYYEVTFPHTGYTNVVRYDNIIHGKVADSTEFISKVQENITIVVGDIYTNFYGAEYRVVRYICKNSNYAKIFEVEFIISGNKAVTREHELLTGAVRPTWSENTQEMLCDIQLGEIRTNKDNMKYKIIEYIGSDQINLMNNYKIKFLSDNSEYIVEDVAILKGTIQNRNIPSLYGIGYLGNAKNYSEKSYKTWSDMLRRCYVDDPNKNSSYKSQGVKVCERWHCFENFLEDLPFIEGFDEELYRIGEIYLDKDKKQEDIEYGKIYSLETCIFLSKRENNLYRSTTKPVIAIDPYGNKIHCVSMNDAQDKTGVLRKFIRECINDRKESHNGYRFIYDDTLKIQDMVSMESNMSRAMSRMPMNYNPFYEPNTGMLRAMIRQPK